MRPAISSIRQCINPGGRLCRRAGMAATAILLLSRFGWSGDGSTLEKPVEITAESWRLDHPPSPLMLGTIFTVLATVQSERELKAVPGPWPRRQDVFTIHRLAVEPLAQSRWQLRAECQAFLTGEQVLPCLPVVRAGSLGWETILVRPGGTITIATGLSGPGPFTPRPPAGGLDIPGAGVWSGLAGLVLAAGFAAACFWWWRRRRKPAGPEPASAEVPVDAETFIRRLDAVWQKRKDPERDRFLAHQMAGIFREFLSWRYSADFTTLTTGELLDTLAGKQAAPEAWLREAAGALQAGDHWRFSQDEGALPALMTALIKLIRELPAAPELEEEHAVISNS